MKILIGIMVLLIIALIAAPAAMATNRGNDGTEANADAVAAAAAVAGAKAGALAAGTGGDAAAKAAGGTGGHSEATAGDSSASTGPVTTGDLTSSPETNISNTTKNRSLMVNMAMAPVNIVDCLTASHIGGYGRDGGALVQWAGINHACLAQKMAEAEDDTQTAAMLKCSIKTYRNAVAFVIGDDGAARRVKGNRHIHCIEREMALAMAVIEAQVIEQIQAELTELTATLIEVQNVEGYDDTALRERIAALEAVAHAPAQSSLQYVPPK